MKNCGISPWKVKLDDDDLPNNYLPLQPKKTHQQPNKETQKNGVVKSERVSREKSRRNSLSERTGSFKKETIISFNSFRPSFLSTERKKKENMK